MLWGDRLANRLGIHGHDRQAEDSIFERRRIDSINYIRIIHVVYRARRALRPKFISASGVS